MVVFSYCCYKVSLHGCWVAGTLIVNRGISYMGGGVCMAVRREGAGSAKRVRICKRVGLKLVLMTSLY